MTENSILVNLWDAFKTAVSIVNIRMLEKLTKVTEKRLTRLYNIKESILTSKY